MSANGKPSTQVVPCGNALAYRGIPLQSAYCGAKHATQGLFDSVRSELLHEGSNVRITMVQMPGLNTPQFEWIRVPHRVSWGGEVSDRVYTVCEASPPSS